MSASLRLMSGVDELRTSKLRSHGTSSLAYASMVGGSKPKAFPVRCKYGSVACNGGPGGVSCSFNEPQNLIVLTFCLVATPFQTRRPAWSMVNGFR